MSLFANAKSALLSDSSTTNSTSEIAQQSNIFSNNTGATGLFSNQAQTQPTSVFANNQPGTFGGGTGISRPTASPAQQQGMFGQFQPASSVFTSNSHVTSAFPPQTTTASGGGLFGNQSGGGGGGGGLFGSQSQSTSEGSGLFGGGGGLISAQAASASLLSGGGNSGGLLGSQGTGGLLSGGGGGLLGSQGNGGGLLSGQPSASLLSGGGGLLGSQIVGGLSGAQIGGGLLGAQTGGGLLGAQSTGGLLGAQPMGMGSNVFGGALTAQQPSASTSQANSNGPSSTNPPGIGTFDHIGRVHVYRDPARDWAVASITGAIPNQGLEELRVRDYLALKRGQVNPDRVREVEQIREQNRRARDSGFIPPPANSIPPNQNVTPPSSNNNGSQFGAQIQAQTTSGGSSLLGGGGGFGGPQAGGFGGGARATGFGSGTQAGGMGGGLPVLSPGVNPLNNMPQMVPNTTGRIIPSTGLATVAQAQPTFGQGGNQIPGGMRQQAGQLIQGGPAGAFGQQQMISGAGASMGVLATRPTFGAGPLGGVPTGTSFGAQPLQQYPQPAIQKFPGAPGMNQSSFIQQVTQFGGVTAPAEKEKKGRGRPKKAQPATQNVNTTSSQFYYEINKMLFVSGFVDLLSKHNFSAPEGLLDDTDFTAKFVEFLEGYDISLPKEGIPKFQVEVAKQTSEEATEVVRRKPRKIVVEDSDSEEEKIDLAEKPKAKKAQAGKKAATPKKEETKPKGKRKVLQTEEKSSEESEEEEKAARKPTRRVSASRSRSPVRQESEQVSRSKSPRRRSTSREQQKKRRPSVGKRQASRSRSRSVERKRSTSRRKSTGARRSSGTLTNQALNGLDGLTTEKTEETQEEAGITTTF